jgi:TolB protein
MKKAIQIIGLILFSTLCLRAQNVMFIQDVSWSPDGKYLAFTGMHEFDNRAGTFKADIYVIGIDGTNLRIVSGDGKNDFCTSWARGRIAFSSEDPGSESSDLFTVNPDGSGLRRITNGPVGKNTTPAFSKDGKRVAFVSTRDGGKDQIYVMNADGTDVKRVTNDISVGFFNPQWSSDGKRIVCYVEKGDGNDQIWTMNADGSNPRLLTANIGHNVFPGWTPDGKQIIFSSSKRDRITSDSYVDGSYLYLMKADGSRLAKIGNIKSFFARVSPDGKKIAFISGRYPATAIYIANVDGSGATVLTKGPK